MFSLNKKIAEQEEKKAIHSGEDVARLAISEDGVIIYANDSFRILSDLPVQQAGFTDVLSVLKFASNIKDISQLKAGPHKISINGQQGEYDFHFNWLTTPDNKRYLVGAEAQETEASLGSFKASIMNAHARAASKYRIENAGDLTNFAGLSDEMMLVIGDFGEIRRVNESFLKIFGYQETDIDNLDFIDLFHDEDKPYIRNTIQTMSLDSESEYTTPPVDFSARVTTQGGQTLWIEWRQRRSGNQIYAIGRDITALRQQQDALSRQKKELSEAESIGRMGHWNWPVGSQNLEWSTELYRIFGVSEKDFQPTFENMRKMVNKRDIGRVNQAFQRAIIEQNDYDMEFRITRPDGDTRFLRCEGRCAIDNGGEVTALYGIMQDMTDRILYERELEEAKNASERAYAAKSQFLANMSHELRTPLNAILGFSEMMHRQLLGPIGTPKYLEYIQGIRQSGEHLLDLISDILDMSKIEAGKYDLDLEEVNIVKTIRLSAHMMESRSNEAKIRLSMEKLPPESLNIVADRRAFLQIMLNLLSNAVKFTPEGGTITIESIEKQDYISIKVIDTGIGIPANKLASITNPFEQVSSHYTRNHEGSGLGLSITKELVEMHGGSLSIESTVGKGTTVTFKLPYDASSKAAKKH